MADPRFTEAISLFNQQEWYACHDGFEALWHETAGAMRPVLQGILQLAVAQLHRERGNLRGATVLMGEGLGRLRQDAGPAFGLDLDGLRAAAAQHLQALQASAQQPQLPPLELLPAVELSPGTGEGCL